MAFEAFDDQLDGGENPYLDGGLANPDAVSLDLSNERLLGIDMQGADLSDANLSRSLIAASNFEGTNLSNASLEGATLVGVNIQSADLTGANLKNSKWISVDVRNADFSGASLDWAKSVRVKWAAASVPPAKKPGAMVTPLVFMPIIVLGGILLSLLLRWRYGKDQ